METLWKRKRENEKGRDAPLGMARKGLSEGQKIELRSEEREVSGMREGRALQAEEETAQCPRAWNVRGHVRGLQVRLAEGQCVGDSAKSRGGGTKV